MKKYSLGDFNNFYEKLVLWHLHQIYPKLWKWIYACKTILLSVLDVKLVFPMNFTPINPGALFLMNWVQCAAEKKISCTILHARILYRTLQEIRMQCIKRIKFSCIQHDLTIVSYKKWILRHYVSGINFSPPYWPICPMIKYIFQIRSSDSELGSAKCKTARFLHPRFAHSQSICWAFRVQ